jgi:hypothetical protein
MGQVYLQPSHVVGLMSYTTYNPPIMALSAKVPDWVGLQLMKHGHVCVMYMCVCVCVCFWGNLSKDPSTTTLPPTNL